MVSFSNKPTERHSLSAKPPTHTHTHTHTKRQGGKPVAWERASHGTAITPKYVRLNKLFALSSMKGNNKCPTRRKTRPHTHTHTQRPDEGVQRPVSTSYKTWARLQTAERAGSGGIPPACQGCECPHPHCELFRVILSLHYLIDRLP